MNISYQLNWSEQEIAFAQKSDDVELGDGGDRCTTEFGREHRYERRQWLLLAAVVDRLFLILYFLICIVVFIRFSSVL